MDLLHRSTLDAGPAKSMHVSAETKKLLQGKFIFSVNAEVLILFCFATLF